MYSLLLAIDYARRFQQGPSMPLPIQGQGGQSDSQQHPFGSDNLSLLHLWFGSPGEKGSHILGHLTGRSRSAIRILYDPVIEITGHGNGTTGKVAIIMKMASLYLHTRRRIRVAGDEGKDVIRTALPPLHNQTEIGWEGTAISRPSRLLVRVGRGKAIGEPSWTHKHFAIVVGTVLYFNLAGFLFGLFGRVRDTDQVAVGDALETVAGGADFLVDLVTTSDATIGSLIIVIIITLRDRRN